MLLETKKVTKIFGGLHANSDIDFPLMKRDRSHHRTKWFRQDYIL